MDQQVKEKIEKEISNNEVCLFMKGTPEVPECGFSMAVVNILKLLEVNYKGAVSYTHLTLPTTPYV